MCSDVRKRVVAVGTACALLTLLLVSTLSFSGGQTPLVIAGAVLVAYIIHLIGVLEDRVPLFHLGLYGAAYAHGMQFMYYYATGTWWKVPSVAALALATCCCAYTGFTIGLMARAQRTSSTVQPARECEDETKGEIDYV